MAERLHVAIARAGLCSRRQAEKLVSQGRVAVNGTVIREQGTQVDPSRDIVTVDQKPIPQPGGSVTMLLNKPKGVVTTAKDPQGRPTVMDLLRGVRERVFPVGRLDYQTEGLLLLTNDGELSQLLQHPRHGISKTYHAKVKGIPREDALDRLRKGITLDGRPTAPARVKRSASTGRNTWLDITIREGRNRQIRRMCAKVGHPVMKLKRVRYGPLTLKNLKPGTYRTLDSNEVRRLYQEAEQTPKKP